MIKSYKYRIYPSKVQELAINQQLEITRQVYNNVLETRIDLWDKQQKSTSLYDSQKWITAWKKDSPELKQVYSQVLQEAAVQVDLAFQGFFRRLKTGETPGFPRFKGYGRLKSLTYKQSGYKFVGDRLKVSKIGYLKIVYHRDLPSVPKRMIIKKTKTNKYYVIFVVEVDLKPSSPTDSVVGIDLGVNQFITLNTGEFFVNPRYIEQSAKRLIKLQRKHQREKTDKTRIALAKQYEKVVNQRNDYYHKTANELIDNYQVICLEDLDIEQMIENGWRRMNKAVLDAGWNTFVNILTYKAEEAGRLIVKVNPAYTSQECSECGHIERANRKSQSEFICKSCGFEENADTNAAINILSRGLSTLVTT